MENLNKKTFYKSILVIAIPVIIQNLINIGLNMIDTVMVSELGENAISAVGLANRIYFIFTTICFGLYSGASIFIAQYWGAKDYANIKKVFGIDLFIGTIISLIFSFIVFIFKNQIINIFIDDPVVIKLGAEYLEVIAFSYFFTAISFAYSFNSRAIHRLKIPTLVSALALFVNAFFNWTLITGNLNFPALGVKGAAIATLAARVFEFATLIILIYKDKNHPLVGKFNEYFAWDKKLLTNIIKTSFPVVMSETAWSVGVSVYFIAYGFIGSYAIAVVQIAYNISDFFQTIFFGIGNASAVLIGNELGRNNYEGTFEISRKFIKITLILSLIMSLLLFILRGAVISIFNIEELTIFYLNKTIIVFTIYLTPKMFGYLFICGILRSGGDTKFCMFVDIVSIWLIGVPLAFISVLILNLPIHYVVAVVFSEEFIKVIALIKRYRSKKWINRVIDYNN